RWPPHRRGRAGLARTFQHARLFRGLTVRENVEVAALGVKASPREARRRATDLLAPWPDAPLTLAGIEAAGKTGARLDPAIRAARTAVARDPSSPSALYSLGSLELAAGQVDRAERTLRTARRWDPQSLLVTQRLAAIARQRGDEARVRTLCHHARELRSGVLCPPPPPTPLRSR
ncbi:MAG: tetratricopeptide repeat protein, partial [Acidimicrobiia bacterium]